MAVSLVALVVLLNATIYSENVATRGIEAADGEALEVRATTVDGTGTLLDATNRHANESTSFGTVEASIDVGVTALDQRVARGYARRGGVAEVTLAAPGVTEGRYLQGSFNDTTEVPAVDRTRGFVIAVDPDRLPTANESTAAADAFSVAFNRSGGAGTERVFLYLDDGTGDGSADDIVAATASNGSDPAIVCRVSDGVADPLRVDLTAETIGGTSCPGLWPSVLVEPPERYTIEFDNTDDADASLVATVLSTMSPTGTVTPTATDAAYDATVEIRYHTAELRFETTVRVAPGEPDA